MNKFWMLILISVLLISCKTSEKIVYFQDSVVNSPETIEENMGIVIQPKDMLSIVVSSKDPELAVMFNLPVVSYQAGSEIVLGGGQQKLLGYIVDIDGTIDFPILGKIDVNGLTRWQLSELIKNRLTNEDLVRDAVVTVEFMNFRISVLGEVKSPGTYTINGDRITILEAISKAQDLTIHGKRDKIFVIREINGERIIYNLDIRSVDLFNSPAYYLQQNDIVYIEPNKVRAGQSTINENSFRSASFWMSLTSVITTLAVLIFK